MAKADSQNMVLVYDLRRNRGHRERVLSQVEDQWQAYQRGEVPAQISEGRISRLFFYPHDGEHMFELNEGARRSTWVRQGDGTWYTVGWRAKVEQVVFHTPPPVGPVPVVTRIWITNRASSSGGCGPTPRGPFTCWRKHRDSHRSPPRAVSHRGPHHDRS